MSLSATENVIIAHFFRFLRAPTRFRSNGCGKWKPSFSGIGISAGYWIRFSSAAAPRPGWLHPGCSGFLDWCRSILPLPTLPKQLWTSSAKSTPRRPARQLFCRRGLAAGRKAEWSYGGASHLLCKMLLMTPSGHAHFVHLNKIRASGQPSTASRTHPLLISTG